MSINTVAMSQKEPFGQERYSYRLASQFALFRDEYLMIADVLRFKLSEYLYKDLPDEQPLESFRSLTNKSIKIVEEQGIALFDRVKKFSAQFLGSLTQDDLDSFGGDFDAFIETQTGLGCLQLNKAFHIKAREINDNDIPLLYKINIFKDLLPYELDSCQYTFAKLQDTESLTSYSGYDSLPRILNERYEFVKAPQKSDLVLFMNEDGTITHLAISLGNDLIESKWDSQCSIYTYKIDDAPLGFGHKIIYLRLKKEYTERDLK